ncbi:protein-disulfide reductase DsbD family protein [Hydrocarboniphaga sp.]|uniref:protein-disulfide reductase DsbD family protein n=1 Tax=Hydrocarboniphaga sp. TaxID=2033016 RepID=UPI003D10829B
MKIKLGALLALVVLSLPSLPARAATVQAEHIEVELLAENSTLTAGEQTVALRIRPESGWHVYWRNPGDSGLPTKLAWQNLPAGASAGELQWPYPEEHNLGDLTNYGYGEETLLPLQLTLPDSAPAEPLKAKASWLVCADICIPGKADLSLDTPYRAGAAQPDPAHAVAFAETRAKLPVAAPFAAQFQIDGGEFRLQAGPLPGRSQQLAFYPYAGDVLAHAGSKKQAYDSDDRIARLARPVSGYFVQAPQAVEGVLVIGEGHAAKAYEIRATPGTVAAVAGTAAKAAGAMTTAAPDAPGFWLVLALAFGGGLILNLMPCVFPVLSLKALSVMKVQQQAAAEHRRHALAYTAGVVLSFVAAAGVLIALRAGGAALGWGFQLQSPLFVGLLVYVMLALGLSLSGVIEFGSSWMGAGQNLAAKPGLSGSFFTGVLAVIVASPCTAPFMGTALGYALTQPAIVSLTVFLALALGLAFPFLLIGFVPRLAAWLPRPGAWMETLKQVLAFPLYLTAVWLLWVIGGLTDRNGMGLAMVGAVLLAFGLWLLGRARNLVVKLLALAALIAAVALLFHPLLRASTEAPNRTAAVGVEPYSDARLAELIAQKRTVFVDFTADWCLTCKVNERVALHSQTVIDAFEKHQVVSMVADWTRADPAITATLARYGRSGVPLYLVSVGGAEPRVLPQVLTPDLVAQAVAGP